MKLVSSLLLALPFVATSAIAQDAAVTLFSIKEGEKLLLRNVSTATTNCEPLFEKFEAIDVLDGPSELSVTFEPGMVTVNTSKGRCEHEMPGGKVFITAKDITERKEAQLIFRVRFVTKNGPWQQTAKFRILMFPGTKS